MSSSHLHIKFAAIVKFPFRPHSPAREVEDRVTKAVGGQPGGHHLNPEHSNMSEYDNDHLCSLRAALRHGST
jgi:hypothetical protein